MNLLDKVNKRYLASIIFTILVFGIFGLYALKENRDYKAYKDGAVHWHAGFQVYIDDKLIDFSDYRYMEISPCGHHEEDVDWRGNEQKEKAHLHDGNGDVVHVHRNNGKWRDLFTNMKYQFPVDKLITGYIDGKEVENILDEQIKDDVSAVILVGESTNIEQKLANSIKTERIHEVEQLSENCGASDH